MLKPIRSLFLKSSYLALLLVLCSTLCKAQNITFSGYVRDEISKEALINATVKSINTKSGVITNQYGYFSITVPKADTTTFLISYSGYEPVIKKVVNGQSVQMNILLRTNLNNLKEVTISGNRNNDNVTKPQMGVIDVPVQSIKDLPVLLGERDILKIVQLLPGVQQGQEGTTGFYVRGGNLDQNLIQLDEATLYNPNHLFGLFSTFNVNSVNSVKLIKGGFPAQYGGRLSSILDITLKDGNKTKYETEAGIGLLSANLTFQGPIQKNRSSFIVSARRSYINLLLHPLTSNTTSQVYFLLLCRQLPGTLNFKLKIMKNIIIFKLVILCGIALTLASCEKVIDVKMNNATGKIDIEANLTNVQGQQIVYIRQNVPFTNTNTYPPVTGATVTISDQAGNTYPFVEGPSGTYAINNLAGVTGNTYQLMVNAKGSIYTAKSITPAAINLDTILSKNNPFGGTKRKQLISVVYKDPAGVPNQYRFVMYVNGVQVKRVFAFDDEFTDGKTNTTDLDQEDIDIYPGDAIKVEMQCIDLPIYTYWFTLLQQGDRGPVGSVAPANPPSNLSNNALGYFSAHTTQTETIIIK